MFNQISRFFNSRRKKSSSKQHSDTDTSTPTSPLSPRSVLSEEEDGQKTPTSSRKDCEPSFFCYAVTRAGEEHGECISQSSNCSTPSMVSLLTCDAHFPFADSNNSGGSSVRQVSGHRISTASTERKSGNMTPTNLDIATTPFPDSISELGFAESLIEDINLRLQSSIEQEGSKQDKAVNHTTLSTLKIPLSKESAPTSSKLSSVSVTLNKSSVIGDQRHSSSIRERNLGTPSSSLRLIAIQPENEKRLDTSREYSGTEKIAWSPSCEQEPKPKDNFTVAIHKAIWVETHLGEEELEKHEGGQLKDVMKEIEEGPRAVSPPMLAVPVTVNPEDGIKTQSTIVNSSVPSETLSPCDSLSPSGTVQEFQTISQQADRQDTASQSKPSSLCEKHRSRELRVTRKTVNLPSKHKVLAQMVCVTQQQNLNGREPARQEDGGDITANTTDTTEVKL